MWCQHTGVKIIPREWNFFDVPLLTFQRSRTLGPMHRAMLACHDSLFRYARALTRDSADAEELVQECFRRALAAGRQPSPEDSEGVRRWMFVILRNIFKNAKRAQGREDGIDAAGDVAAASEQSPENQLLRRALQLEIRTALDSLTESHREIIVLRDMEGLSYAAIANVLACPVGTVMSRLARARAQLRFVLAEVVGVQARREARQ